MTSLRTVTTTLLVLLLAAGCASTEKRYDKAGDLEAEGRYAEAAAYYIKVLEKEPGYEDARARLRDAGARAIAMLMDEARAAEARSDYDAAVRALDRLEHLIGEADGVGITLQEPDGFAAYRAAVTADGVRWQLARGDEAEREGRWRRALAAYERAATYTADPATRRLLAERQAAAHLGWAEDEAGAARYHAAFDRAAHALDLVGADHPLGRRADALRAEAAEAGTVRVAFLPFWRTDAVGRAASDAFVHDLNDVLVYDYLAAPAAFVAVADPVDVRRSLRRLDLDRRILTDRQAADLGRAGDADLVVVGEVIAFERSERIGKETRRRALLKGRPSTTEGPKEAEWIEQRLTLAFDAEVAYRIVDPRTRRVLDRGTVRAEVVDRLRRGVYAGDYRTLDLDGEALSLFEDAEPQAVEELENALADALASRLAERLYTRLLVQIP